MSLYKCKNSVFCVSFLICFTLGTICGVFAFRCFLSCASDWNTLVLEGFHISNMRFWALIGAWFRTLAVVALFALLPTGYRAILPLVVVKAFLIAYLFSALQFYRVYAPFVVFKELSALPMFYWICKWVYFRWDVSYCVR